jgi:hypothetical protein
MFAHDSVWGELNQRRIVLEGRMEIQRQVMFESFSYEQTTENIKQLVERSIPCLNLKSLMQKNEKLKEKIKNIHSVPKNTLKRRILEMNIEGAENSKKSELVTIELLKQRSLAYRESPSIELYIEEVLEE